MLRTLILAASVSALALSACAENDPDDEAALNDGAADEESGMASANSRLSEDGSALADAQQRRDEADARMEGGMDREGSAMNGAGDQPVDEPQSDAMSDFTYGSAYSEAGAGTAPPTDAIQQATDRILGMTDDEIADFDGEAEAYVRSLVQANLYQVEAGRIAAERGGEPQIRALGERMQEVHQNQLQSLREAIQTGGLGMEPPQELDAPGRDVLQALRNVAEVNFDPVFVRQQTDLHESLNQLHQAYAEAGAVETLTTFAEASAEVTSQQLERLQADHEAALDPN